MPYPMALALTLLVEVPLYTVALTRAGGIRPARAAAAAVLVNLATHPLLWWFLGHGAARSTGSAAAYWTAFGLGEAAVCAVEAALLRPLAGTSLRGPLPWAASGTANAASVLAGLLAGPLITGRW
ncbi:hypothetical protein [Streptomyces sp. CB01881]|uniref:hypothetical protein n=1 Tax=Streptomyces sp. CB01881 TaxID=2078691 RepID=UPI0011DFDE7B|nr:hypothetical protein [Streptomyces sp. CB01881]TYC71192.1 hypothetical protein EH183_25730 [Streptomyces sp. CB01881]